jgi:NADH dehydrogenase (ubiquinone) 1 beta subcomplex subunit 10
MGRKCCISMHKRETRDLSSFFSVPHTLTCQIMTTHQRFERVPTLDEVDPKDYKAVQQARKQEIREQWVKVMEARIIREKLSKCYRTQGVNHYEQCRHLAEEYVRRRPEARVHGYLKVTDPTLK